MTRHRNWIQRIALVLVVLVFAGGVALAQRKVRFDPTRDLPGFEDARSSEFRDLFPIDAYSKLLGTEMESAELEAHRAKWIAESVVAQARATELGADPKAASQFRLSVKLSTHPFFTKISYSIDDSVAPFSFLIQDPPRADPEYAPGIVKQYGPLLKKVLEIFETRVTTPAKAKRRVDRPMTTIVILASLGDYQNYGRVTRTLVGRPGNARHDSALDAVVSFVDPFATSKDSAALMAPVLEVTCAALFDAYLAPPAKHDQDLWLVQGLATTLASRDKATIASLEGPRANLEIVRHLVRVSHDPKKRLSILSLAELTHVRDWDDLQLLSERMMVAASTEPGEVSKTFLGESALWVHFLLNEAHGKYRSGFERCVESVMSGTRSTEALAPAFSGISLSDLDREFWSWVYDSHQAELPSVPIVRADIDALVDQFTQHPLTVRGNGTPGNPVAPHKMPVFSPASLVIAPADFESRHGMALLQARAGDFDGAKSALDALVMGNPPAPNKERIDRDRDRIAAAIRLRDGYLDYLRQNGGRLAIDYSGKKINALITRIANATIFLAENKQGVTSIPLIELDPAEIARLADKPAVQGGAPSWTRNWIQLLTDDPKWDKQLKAGPETRALVEDGHDWYPGRLRAGRAALRIDELSQHGLLTTRAEAEPILERIRGLMNDSGDLASVVSRKSNLRTFAQSAADVASRALVVDELVHGKITVGPGGKTKLVYEFDREIEALDFAPNRGHLAAWRQSFYKLALQEVQSTLAVRAGALRLRGDACWRLPIEFSSPMSMSVEFNFGAGEKGVMHPSPYGAFHLCDDAVESFIHVSTFGQMHVRDAATGLMGATTELADLYLDGRTYHMAIVADGKEAFVTIEGKEYGRSNVGPRVSGGIEIMVHSELDLVIGRLEIEGYVDDRSLAAARRAWAAKRLAEAGF